MPKFDKPFESCGFEEDIRREDLLDNNKNSKRGPNVQDVFFGQSSSFRRIQRPDGVSLYPLNLLNGLIFNFYNLVEC